jgi:glucose uptake protein GlcU
LALCFTTGFAAGVTWNVANAAGILAIKYLGYTLAYPIMQSGVFVGGLWGLCVFDEMKDRKARKIYWLSGLVLLAGVTCLALAR